MPGAWAHSFYWQADTQGAPAAAPPVASYPAWQTTIIIGSGFGAVQVAWEWLQHRRAAREGVTHGDR